jgi:hypothetical protein
MSKYYNLPFYQVFINSTFSKKISQPEKLQILIIELKRDNRFCPDISKIIQDNPVKC